MELTITENGALYALQHRAPKNIHSAPRKREITNRIIRTDKPRPEMLADRKIKTEEVCFI
jgi:hypothetical protein